jgi:hypothetical protein
MCIYGYIYINVYINTYVYTYEHTWVFFFVAMMREDENESKNEKRANYNTIQCNETISCDGGGKRYQTKIAFYEIQPFT